MALDNADYERDYKTGEKPRRLRMDSRYGLCFRNCLYHFAIEALKRRYKKKLPELHIVLEAGHVNWGDAERIFNEVKAELDALGSNILRTITKAAKDESDPLMMADFLAHSTYLMELKERAGSSVPRSSSNGLGKGQLVTHLRYEPNGLAKLKTHLIETLNARGASARRPASQGQSS